MSIIKDVIKKYFPFLLFFYNPIKRLVYGVKKRYYIIIVKRKQKEKLKELKGKDRIKCVMMVFTSSSFRDYLFQLLTTNKRFEIAVVVCPMFNQNVEFLEEQLISCYNELRKKGYEKIYMGYDVKTGEVLDIKEKFNPDILIYTNPYKSLIGGRNYVTKYTDVLTIYIPYYINNTVEYKLAYDELMHNVTWRYYVETDWHKELSKKYSSNHARNVVVSGYSGFDRLVDRNYHPSDKCWKIKDPNIKRIVWAPHQTIDPNNGMYYSAFLLIADQMLELVQKYKDQIQIAFKPHPLLKKNLYKEWGKEKTDFYYLQWNSMANTTIINGEYVDLFLTSDAIIHDSASFITEYLILNKPSLRTNNGRDLRTQFNAFSIECLNYYYMANNFEEVESFVINLIKGIDPLRENRTTFVNKLIPPNGKLPSENIINDILNSIDNQILYR